MPPPSDLKGRPIVAGPLSPTKNLSKLLDKILSPIVPFQKSYIKDDWAFVRHLPNEVAYQAELFTCDIVSLYTSIPHDLGLEAIKYWIQKRRNHIPERFNENFIIDCIAFVLNNNNFYFDGIFYHQLHGTGMGVDFAAPYACLTIGYLEESKLFGPNIQRYFNHEDVKIIEKAFKRYMDDGFILWPTHLNIDILIDLLNQLHPDIKYTIERGDTINGTIQTINFLDIKVLLHNNKTLETEIFYKSTNNHHYLDYDSFHVKHVKDNIPFNLAKRIIIFTTNAEKSEKELCKLKKWLIHNQYPSTIIDKAFHNAKLQGPANDPAKRKQVIPLITRYCDNYTGQNIIKKTNMLLQNCPDTHTKNTFHNKKIILANSQPPSILRN